MFYDFKKVRKFLDDSIVLKLMRRGDVLCFLHREFVENDVSIISESELAKHWEGYQQKFSLTRPFRTGNEAWICGLKIIGFTVSAIMRWAVF